MKSFETPPAINIYDFRFHQPEKLNSFLPVNI